MIADAAATIALHMQTLDSLSDHSDDSILLQLNSCSNTLHPLNLEKRLIITQNPYFDTTTDCPTLVLPWILINPFYIPLMGWCSKATRKPSAFKEKDFYYLIIMESISDLSLQVTICIISKKFVVQFINH